MFDNTFNLEEEFPNFFKLWLDTVPDTDKEKSILKLRVLLEKKMQSIVNTLEIPYVDENDKLQRLGFFKQLVEKIQEQIPKDKKDEYTLSIYLGGGVVRTILAFIYKKMHDTLMSDDAFKMYSKPVEEESVRSILTFIYKTVRDTLRSDASKMYFDSVVKSMEMYPAIYKSEDESEDALRFLPTNDMLEKHKALLNSINSHEYRLLRGIIHRDKNPLLNSFVLGVGSDLDLYFTLKPKNPEAKNEEEIESISYKIKSETTTFINNAEKHVSLRDCKDTLKYSVVPIADVKELGEQMKRTLSQGGSMLDTMTFEISHNDKPRLKGHGNEDILKLFFDGFYEYMSPPKDTLASQKQTIRGQRALFEIPFLQLTPESKKVLSKEFDNMTSWESLDYDAKQQVKKMVRNAHFEGAHNRVHRTSTLPSYDPLVKFIALVGENFPKFLQRKRIGREQTGIYQDSVQQLLITYEQFKQEHTFEKSGIIYHGTSPDAFVHILRNGFIESNHQQGLSAYGPGVYCSPELNTAKSYGDAIFKFQLVIDSELRIINWQDLVEKENTSLYNKLKKEADVSDKDQEDVITDKIFMLLRHKYNIDVIINAHIILQNLNAVVPINSLKEILDGMYEHIASKASSLKSNVSLREIDELISNLKTYISLVTASSSEQKDISNIKENINVTLQDIIDSMPMETLENIARKIDVLNNYEDHLKVDSLEEIKQRLIEPVLHRIDEFDNYQFSLMFLCLSKYDFKIFDDPDMIEKIKKRCSEDSVLSSQIIDYTLKDAEHLNIVTGKIIFLSKVIEEKLAKSSTIIDFLLKELAKNIDILEPILGLLADVNHKKLLNNNISPEIIAKHLYSAKNTSSLEVMLRLLADINQGRLLYANEVQKSIAKKLDSAENIDSLEAMLRLLADIIQGHLLHADEVKESIVKKLDSAENIDSLEAMLRLLADISQGHLLYTDEVKKSIAKKLYSAKNIDSLEAMLRLLADINQGNFLDDLDVEESIAKKLNILLECVSKKLDPEKNIGRLEHILRLIADISDDSICMLEESLHSMQKEKYSYSYGQDKYKANIHLDALDLAIHFKVAATKAEERAQQISKFCRRKKLADFDKNPSSYLDSVGDISGGKGLYYLRLNDLREFEKHLLTTEPRESSTLLDQIFDRISIPKA